jgi:hypothetical protein
VSKTVNGAMGLYMLDAAFRSSPAPSSDGLARAAMARTTAARKKQGAACMNPLSQNKAWSYVGRFITRFARIENTVNQLLVELIGGCQPISLTLGLFVAHSFDLRKKLELIDVILKRRGIDESKTFKRVHELHDLRNVIVHNPFEEELDGRLSCDFINKSGHTVFRKPGTSVYDDSITFAEFDSYDAVASELYKKLRELWESATPITEVSDELRAAMTEVIDSSVH